MASPRILTGYRRTTDQRIRRRAETDYQQPYYASPPGTPALARRCGLIPGRPAVLLPNAACRPAKSGSRASASQCRRQSKRHPVWSHWARLDDAGQHLHSEPSAAKPAVRATVGPANADRCAMCWFNQGRSGRPRGGAVERRLGVGRRILQSIQRQNAGRSNTKPNGRMWRRQPLLASPSWPSIGMRPIPARSSIRSAARFCFK